MFSFSDDNVFLNNVSEIQQTILNIADNIEQQYLTRDKRFYIDQQFYHYCESAINYHYDRIDHLLNANVVEQRKLMLNLLNGIPARDLELDKALVKDNLI